MNTATEPGFIVKICGITNEEDAHAAVDAGANAIGFNFYDKSPRLVTPEHAKRIAMGISGAYLKVGIFVNAREDEMFKIAGFVGLNVLQLHGDHVHIPGSRQYAIWRAVSAEALPVRGETQIDAYLADSPTPDFGGSGRTFDWRLAAGRPYRTILAGGLASDNVEEAIEAVRPWGVDACSRLESHPGKKDAQMVRDFVQAARAAAHTVWESSR